VRQPDKEGKGVGPAGQPKKRGRDTHAPGPWPGWLGRRLGRDGRRERGQGELWATRRGKKSRPGRGALAVLVFFLFCFLFPKRILKAIKF